MITINLLDVRLAGAGSTHAAVSAAALKRIAAAKTQRPWIGALLT